MSSDEQSDKECPLCMEPFEEINFYPCACHYQICTFCWHRLRTDDNGLCPACRQPYPEQPVNYQPLSSAEIQKLKNEKKQKHLQKNNKLSESGGRKTDRQHLSAFRVLQRNLVYVIGLSQRIADAELLKKNEYFGKFGKIVKVAVGAFQNNTANNSNNNSNNSNAQPTSYTAYVTYGKIEDALRAIQAVNNLVVDGRLVKASLGTTKYCSNFLKGQQCHKQECMYLHEVADDELSFTKDDMHQGKHTEYERKLHEQMLSQIQQHSEHNHSRSSSTTLTSNNATNFSTSPSSVTTGIVSGASSSSGESPTPIQTSVTSTTAASTGTTIAASTVTSLTNGQPKSRNSGEKNGKREKMKEKRSKCTTSSETFHNVNGQSNCVQEEITNNKKNGRIRKESTKSEVKPPPGFSKIVTEKSPPLLESQMSIPVQGSSAWTMIDEDRHNFREFAHDNLFQTIETFGMSNSLFSISSMFPTSTTTTMDQPSSSSVEPPSGVESLFQGSYNGSDVDDDELKMKLMSADTKAVMTCNELERLLLNTTVPPGFNREDSLNSFSGAATKSSRQTPVPSGMNFFLDLYDDLGFDPFSESSKALADMLEEEKTSSPS